MTRRQPRPSVGPCSACEAENEAARATPPRSPQRPPGALPGACVISVAPLIECTAERPAATILRATSSDRASARGSAPCGSLRRLTDRPCTRRRSSCPPGLRQLMEAGEIEFSAGSDDDRRPWTASGSFLPPVEGVIHIARKPRRQQSMKNGASLAVKIERTQCSGIARA